MSRTCYLYVPSSTAAPSRWRGCGVRRDTAMLLDMNALEHTYLALYKGSGARPALEHLLKGMDQIDVAPDGGAPLRRVSR